MTQIHQSTQRWLARKQREDAEADEEQSEYSSQKPTPVTAELRKWQDKACDAENRARQLEEEAAQLRSELSRARATIAVAGVEVRDLPDENSYWVCVRYGSGGGNTPIYEDRAAAELRAKQLAAKEFVYGRKQKFCVLQAVSVTRLPDEESEDL